MDRLETQRTVQQLRKLVDRQGSCVRPFVENQEIIMNGKRKWLHLFEDNSCAANDSGASSDIAVEHA